MTGLIYLNGCNGDVRAYATQAEGHHASLWVEPDDLNESQTSWWEGLRRDPRSVGKDQMVIEFEIPGPADIKFPGSGEVTCSGLEDGLPKLKKQKAKQKADDPDEPVQAFQVTPGAALTNAEVAVEGGSITPRRFKEVTLVEWTITDPGLAIVVTSRDDPADSRTITLNNADAEVLFLNMHELPEKHGEQDTRAGDHVHHHQNLNPDPSVTVFAVDAKAPGRVGQLASVRSAALNFIRDGGCSCGSSTCCCDN